MVCLIKPPLSAQLNYNMIPEKAPSPTEESAPLPELKKSESRKNSEDKTVRKQSNKTYGARKPSSEIRTKKSSTGEGQLYIYLALGVL